MKHSKRRLAPGKKVHEWESERRKLKREYELKGITSCELKLSGCWKDNALSFAHSKKRNWITGGELSETILCCTPCHSVIELLTHEQMYRIVRSVIAKRER